MSTLEALWLGIVQGLTEFFPVSSSGHLVLFQEWFGDGAGEGLLFEVGVHVATLLAIVVFYRERIAALVRGLFSAQVDAWRYAAKLGVATVPAVAVGLLARNWVETAFDAPAVTGVGLLVTGTILFTTRFTQKNAHAPEPGWWVALGIGCAQALAILPGISRSGSTVAMALALGVAPLAAAEFSFLLGIIAISGAAVLILPDLSGMGSEGWTALGLACGAALVAGLFALRAFVWLLERRAFYAFAYYDWAVGAAFLAWLALG